MIHIEPRTKNWRKKMMSASMKERSLKGFQFVILHSLFLILLLLCTSGAVAVAACNANQPQNTPTADFTDNGDGTVTHSKTGLMWKQCSEGLSTTTTACDTGAAATYTWQGALQQAEALNAGGGFAGHTDWRVPNIKELASIVEKQCSTPAINAVIFPATPASLYWSSSSYSAGALDAWVVFFTEGNGSIDFKTDNIYVRVVR